MGKKILSQVKAKISKTSSCCNEKKPLMNSLIKVLRPKVYIIESSSFKSLVQQLTGNPTVSSSPSSYSYSSSSLPQISDQKLVPVIEVEDDHGNPESSMEFSSFDASDESIFQRESSLVYGDLQAFVQLDVDEQYFGAFSHVYSGIQQEVSIYDYELTGLI